MINFANFINFQYNWKYFALEVLSILVLISANFDESVIIIHRRNSTQLIWQRHMHGDVL